MSISMQLNIKNSETCQLAHELAAMTGESVTAAVTTALRERLAHKRRERDAEAKLAKIRRLVREANSSRREEPVDHGDWLYDEAGLPK
jgi:antitoxin VapB